MSDDKGNDAATPLCTHCAAPLEGLENFCPECGCPLTFQAASMPLESVYAQGFLWREGAAKPYKAIIPLGMRVTLGPGFLLARGFLAALCSSLGAAWGPNPMKNVLGALLAIALTGGATLLYGAFLFKTTRNYFRQRRAAQEEESNPQQEEEDAPPGDCPTQ